MTDHIKALIDFHAPKYRSKIEKTYADMCFIWVLATFEVKVLLTQYEPFTFHLPGKIKYTPDFVHILADRRLLIVEVKNSKKNKGYRVTRNKLVTAASIYPYFMWAEYLHETGMFEIIDKLEVNDND